MRVAIYARTASREGRPQSPSIIQQLERLRTHVAAQGWALPEGNVFVDDGYSGNALDRPGLARLRMRAKKGELDSVWLVEPERLSRSYHQLLSLSEELNSAGCEVGFLETAMNRQPSRRWQQSSQPE
jgi:site-specific DNA recombinase